MSSPHPIVFLGLSGAVVWLLSNGATPYPSPPPNMPLPDALNVVIPTPKGVVQSTCPELLTSQQVRAMVAPFEPPPGHSYEFARVPVRACRQLSDHIRPDGSKVQRHLYESEDGLRLAALVENGRVIGLQYFPEE